MQLENGYQQTEYGLIPAAWDAISIQQLIDSGAIIGHLDGNHGALYPRSNEFTSHGVPYVTANDFQGCKVDLGQCKCLSPERASKFRKGVAKNGDVLFAHNATVGPVAILWTTLNYVILSTTATYFRCNPAKISNIFLLYALQSPHFAEQYQSVMAQSTRNQVPITAQRKLSIILPPNIIEQEAIAEALSDADALIESLEQLLAKKRLIKQGSMQELLTGKKRLPGFSGEWREMRLGDIGEVSGAGVDKKSRKGEVPVRLVNYLDVYRNFFIYSDILSHWVTAPPLQARRCAVKRGDVFFTPSSETRDDIAVSAVAMEDIPDAVYSYHVVRLRIGENWDINFRAYAFKTRSFLEQAETLCDGSGTRYVITLPKFRNLTVSVPSLLEQTAIAAILCNVDAEIDVVEAKLAKTRQIKQGMMQQLLTGRVRLK